MKLLVIRKKTSTKVAFNQDFLVPESIEKAKTNFTNAIAKSATIIDEYILKKKDGSTFNAIIKAAPIKSGDKTIGLRGIVTDITEQKKITETLVFQSQLLEAVGQALIAVDKNRIIRYWNRGAENLYGYTAEEALGKSIDEVFPTEHSEDLVDEISSRLVSGESWVNETQVKSRNGKMVPVIVTRHPVLNKAREFIGAISVYTDITDQKSMQNEIAKYAADFKESSEKVKDLNEKLRVIGGLTRHDVRNKLAVFNGYVYLLRKKIGDTQAALQYLTKMDEASNQMLAILDFEKVYEQVGSEQLVFVNVGKFFAEACGLISDFKGINQKCECDGLEVLADSLLRQLFII